MAENKRAHTPKSDSRDVAHGRPADTKHQPARHDLTSNHNQNLTFVENDDVAEGTSPAHETVTGAKPTHGTVKNLHGDAAAKPASLKPGGEVGTLVTERRWNKRRILVGLAALVVLAGAGLASWTVWQQARYNSPEAKQQRAKEFEAVSGEARQQGELWQYGEEVSTLEAYLESGPDEEHRDKAAMSLAKAYVNNKQYDEAIELYKELEKKPEYELDARRGLGAAYLGKDDKAQARKYFQQVVDTMKTKTDPESIFRLTSDEAQLNAAEE